jgi:ubiquinone/menaquinone biosynthesis C-methylase UbiE
MAPPLIDATLDGTDLIAPRALPIPRYLEQLYWWAYVHPNAVNLFEREWLVNAILFGNYGRLRDAALAELGETIHGKTLQIACVYGNLTPRLQRAHGRRCEPRRGRHPAVQLDNLAKKLPADKRIALKQSDASSLPSADAHYDQVLLFFLLHEMPENVRRATLSEAMRVLKPGGKLVIVDYHRPARFHPLRPLMHQVFKHLEPYAVRSVGARRRTFHAAPARPGGIRQTDLLRRLYQKLVLTR